MSEPKEIDFSTVLASSVHDMKNSVSMLLASLHEVIESLPPGSLQSEQVNSLQYEASRINNELVSLLSVYRMQEKRLPLHIDAHYVIDVLEDQVARNYPLIESRGVHLQVECDNDLEGYFDADLIGSVIQNVLVNGCRYTCSKLLLRAEQIDDMLRISVADDGEGFPEEMLRNHEQCIPGEQGSTQLGLFFARMIAERHANAGKTGRITLRNGQPLGGAVFELYVPS